jgi:thiamine biosynthesis protein ThiI
MPDRPDAPAGVIVLRIGEIFLKGQNRRAFFRRFVKNARALVADLDGVTVEARHLRAVVRHPPALGPRCTARLGRLFGLSSMSPAVTVARDLDAFADEAIRAARALPAGASFKVETRRRDKRFPMTSQDVSREVGGRVAEATGLRVDVHHPDHRIEVEIGLEECFVYAEVLPGPGGLPVGTSGRVALLLSGGIDSPVAGWYAMRRGCTVGGIYFHSFPYTGNKTREKVLDLARQLAAWEGSFTLRVVHFTDVQKALRGHGPAEYAVVLYRRMMMRAASELARRDRALALVTGENLGQVASQTLENLGVIEDAARLPVLRPLLTFDKDEIVREARRIGTFETSILPYDDCCSLFVPRHPVTRARLRDVAAAEAGLDVDAMAAELADAAERVVVTP